MYLARDLDAVLLDWFHARAGRKPFVLRGARQTGKSTTVRRLGDEAPLFVELNLERFRDRALVRACRSADELLEAVALREDLASLPSDTVLFLDEIQELPEVMAWLRYLHEDHPEIAVLCAGSLLEVRLAERGFSFPVGRVTFATLHPFSFSEFLRATSHATLDGRLRETARTLTSLPPVLHGETRHALRDYVRVGGMPEAVIRWRATSSTSAVARVHADLWQALAEDIQKYRGARDPGHLEAAFAALPLHYGLRFKYQDFAPGHASRAMHTALDKLEGARLITRVLPTSSVQLPLRTKPRAAPKLIPLDIGLAVHALGIGPELNDGRGADLLRLSDGRIAEMVVGQQLRPFIEDGFHGALHFWVRESSRANAEVDFLVPVSGRAVPIEVKSGSAGTLRSLHQFLARTDHALGIRIYGGPLALEKHEVQVGEDRVPYRLLNVPLPLAAYFRELARGMEALTWK